MGCRSECHEYTHLEARSHKKKTKKKVVFAEINLGVKGGQATRWLEKRKTELLSDGFIYTVVFELSQRHVAQKTCVRQ